MILDQPALRNKERSVSLNTRLRRAFVGLFLLVIASEILTPDLSNANPRRLSSDQIELKFLGRYSSGIFGPDAAGAESLAHDPRTQRLFVVNVANRAIDVLDIKNPRNPKFLFAIDLTPFGANANSVAVHQGIVAVAVQANVKTNPGMAVFFDAHGMLLNAVQVGALPDMIVFTPDGKKVLTANEGEPNSYNRPDSFDPEGSISIIDISGGVRNLMPGNVVTAGFTQFNNAVLDPSIRIFGPNATVAQDLEPEYIAVSEDSKSAWVTLQENNALAHLDLVAGTFTKLMALGTKDHGVPGNGIDASDEDGAINIANWPVKGFYMPDAIAYYTHNGKAYLVTANEGDARDYDGFAEEERVADLDLEPQSFPNAAQLQLDANLGRLTVTLVNGENAAGMFQELFAFGGRSFSIWDENGQRVFDSGDDFERIIAERFPNNFNSNNEANDFDNRSDNKGPEPEGVTIAHIGGAVYGFIALERIGGIMVYDITDPFDVSFVDYVNTRNFNVNRVCLNPNEEGDCEQGSRPHPGVGDLGAEVIRFIDASDSPTGKPLLAVANEITGTTSTFEIVRKSRPALTTGLQDGRQK